MRVRFKPYKNSYINIHSRFEKTTQNAPKPLIQEFFPPIYACSLFVNSCKQLFAFEMRKKISVGNLFVAAISCLQNEGVFRFLRFYLIDFPSQT